MVFLFFLSIYFFLLYNDKASLHYTHGGTTMLRKMSLAMSFLLLFSLSLYLSDRVHAEGNSDLKPLLRGEPLYVGQNLNNVNKITQLLTDNDLVSQYLTLDRPDRTNTYAWYHFERPTTINGYTIKSANHNNYDKVQLSLYDKNMNLLYQLNGVSSTETLTPIEEIKNVYTVALHVKASALTANPAFHAVDFDLYNYEGKVIYNGEDLLSNLHSFNDSSVLRLFWNDSSNNPDFDHYSIYRNDIKIGESKSTFFMDKNLLMGTSYKYTIKSVNNSGASSTGISSSFIPMPNPNYSIISPSSIAYRGVSDKDTSELSPALFDGTNTAVKLDYIRASRPDYRQWVWSNFSNNEKNSPYTIGAYKIKGIGSSNSFELLFYDSADNIIYTNRNLETTGEIIAIPKIQNVAKFALHNISTSTAISVIDIQFYQPGDYDNIVPPSKPQNLKTSDVLKNYFVTWDANLEADVVEYRLHWNGVPRTQTQSTNLYNFGGASAQQTTIQVSAISKNGLESEPSDPVVVTLSSYTPARSIENLSETHQDRWVSLSFNSPKDDLWYDHTSIFRDGKLIAKVDGNTSLYTDKWLDPETTYSYQVRTFYKNGNSGYSELLYITTLPDTFAPSEVVSISHINLVNDDYTLRYQLPSEVDFKQVNIYENGELIGSSLNNEFNVGEILPSETRTFTLTTVDELGNESEGVTYTVSILEDTTPPANVTNISSSVTDSIYSLSFELPSDRDFTHVNIYQGDTLLGTSKSGLYTLGDLEQGASYTYLITSVDRYGNESTGEEHVIVIPDTLPPGDVTSLSIGSLDEEQTQYLLTYDFPSDVDFSHVNIYVDGNLIASTIESSFLLSSEQVLGRSIVVTTVDFSGNESSGQTMTLDI